MSNATIILVIYWAVCSSFMIITILERQRRKRAERELSKLKRELEALVERWK